MSETYEIGEIEVTVFDDIDYAEVGFGVSPHPTELTTEELGHALMVAIIRHGDE